MRNYIHVHLCISLMVAQITFVAGIDKTDNKVSLPLAPCSWSHPLHALQAGCQAVAVMLHYFFLVTFMWMLMEGVVLYVALVRVFVKQQKKYILAFTAFSYGRCSPQGIPSSVHLAPRPQVLLRSTWP